MQLTQSFQACGNRNLYVPLLAAVAFLLGQCAGFTQEKPPAVARCEAVEGALLLQDKPGSWRSVAAQEGIPADHLLVALFGADLVSSNGAVDIKLLGDIGERGAFPVLEAGVALHKNPAVDAEITLSRGIVVISNRKKMGPVTVRMRILEAQMDVMLPDGKARLGIEIYGRHIPGVPRLEQPKDDVPVTNVFFFALAGEPVIENEKHTVRLQAPPGNALLHWDSVTQSAQTRYFEELPPSVKALSPEERQRLQTLCGYSRRFLAEKTGAIGQNLDALAGQGGDTDARKVAVTAMGAVDDVNRLVEALGDAKHADARDQAVLVLRHWLGRAPGQSIKLYNCLTKERGYTPIQAKSLIHLLNGIEAAKRTEPSTYEILIHGLNHSKVPMRELARWHLVRLVPDGKVIVYDAGADEAQRQRAIQEWRRLIPEGELPPAPKKKSPE
jgi:hypothetical protein